MKYSLVFLVLAAILPARFASSQVTWTKHTIADNFGGACSVHAQDINGDSLVDVLGAGIDGNCIALWTNNGGNPLSWTQQLLDTLFYGACFVFAEDVDGDGDTDALASAWHGSELAWYENGGGSPIQWTKHSVWAGFYNAHEISAADMDDDGDIDVLGAAALTDEIAWFENDGLDPPGWTQHTVSDSFDGARSVKPADIDGDGLLDVVGAALLSNEVTWWRNNGDATWTEYTLDNTFGMSHMVYAPDIDADGHLDVLGTADITDDVAWYANSGGSPITWTKQMIDGNCNGAWPVYAADLDNDGDIDVLAAANASDDIYWYENGLIGINENSGSSVDLTRLGATIIRGPIRLPQGSDFKILDISGRKIAPDEMSPGIYFIQNGETICQKIIKVE